MSRKKKTPDFLIALIDQHSKMLDHVDEMLRVKRNVSLENQANHIRETTEEQMIGRAEGYNAMLEMALHQYGCYAGYLTTAKTNGVDMPVIESSPHFADWRRRYLTR